MTNKPFPSPMSLRKLLRYDPETGKLFWKERGPEWFKCGARSAAHNANTWNTKYAGKEAICTVNSHGYKTGGVFDRIVKAHRVVWAIEYGEWPNGHIDHISGDRLDNRVDNLRVVNDKINRRNHKMRSDNKSGRVGVCYLKAARKWHAYINDDLGNHLRLGTYAKKECAIKARQRAEIEHGYHQNHGRSA